MSACSRHDQLSKCVAPDRCRTAAACGARRDRGIVFRNRAFMALQVNAGVRRTKASLLYSEGKKRRPLTPRSSGSPRSRRDLTAFHPGIDMAALGCLVVGSVSLGSARKAARAAKAEA